jgi:hypothetical protein
MSVAKASPASPEAPRPAGLPPGGPPRKPRPPFRPVRFVLGLVICLGLLVAQYNGWLGSVLVGWPLSLAASAGLAAPPDAAVTWLRVAVQVAAVVAAMVAFFLWTLRQINGLYWAPILITFVLAGAYFYFNALPTLKLPSWLIGLTGGWVTHYPASVAAILAAIGTELLLGRFVYGKWINPASAYVSGISAGILVESGELFPFIFCAIISIASKYALRLQGRHLWNPTNFGVTVLLLAASTHMYPPSFEYGNALWANLIIWTLGGLILWRIGKLHIPLTFAVMYVPLALYRSWSTGYAWETQLGPITGPIYQLFMCFMITDPKTITQKKWSQCLVAALVAVAETVLRLAPEGYRLPTPESSILLKLPPQWVLIEPKFLAIYSPFLALFTVGPIANVIEIWWTVRKKAAAAAGGVPPAKEGLRPA